MTAWGGGGVDTPAENAAMDAAAARLRNRKLTAASVRAFMRSYLAIGSDPTDTVIRDNVWTFLLRITRGKLTKNEVDVIWRESVERRMGAWCVVQ